LLGRDGGGQLHMYKTLNIRLSGNSTGGMNIDNTASPVDLNFFCDFKVDPDTASGIVCRYLRLAGAPT